jgi:hypothetical protein
MFINRSEIDKFVDLHNLAASRSPQTPALFSDSSIQRLEYYKNSYIMYRKSDKVLETR